MSQTSRNTPQSSRAPRGGGAGADGSGDSSGAAGPGAGFRAILVGRTGLDGVLRRDPDVELVRCRTALDAVGELGNPIDEASPSVAAVFVAEDAAPDDARAFASALRRLDPQAGLFLIVPAGQLHQAPPPYDGAISEAAGAAEVRSAVASLGGPAAPVHARHPAAPALAQPGHRAQPAQPTQTPAQAAGSSLAHAPPGPGPGPAPIDDHTLGADAPGFTHAAPVSPHEVGDLAIARAVLAGRDVALAAVELIRSRVGAADVVFVPSVRVGGQVAPPPAGAAMVAHKDEVFGWLRSARLGERQLIPWGEWLAVWLALQRQQMALRTAATIDDLTGAYNRRYFDRFMAAALDQAHKNRHALTLLVFDIDDFKVFNDRYGHGAGDEILRETVRLLRSVIRPTDRVCRIGGDEFAVIFHEPAGPRDPGSKPPEDVSRIAQRFQQQIREHRFPKLGDCAPGTLTVSGGIATFPWDGRTVTELLERADQFALESKRAGKNAIRIGPGGPNGQGAGPGGDAGPSSAPSAPSSPV